LGIKKNSWAGKFVEQFSARGLGRLSGRPSPDEAGQLIVQVPQDHHRPENHLQSQDEERIANRDECVPHGDFLKICGQRNGNRFSVAIRVPINAGGCLHETPLVNDADWIVMLYRNNH
jgi:hypothetical protein